MPSGSLAAALHRVRETRLMRRSLQLHLALLYAGLFFVCGVGVLFVPVINVRSSLPAFATGAQIAQEQAAMHAAVIRSTVTLIALVLASVLVGWLIAGLFTRPLRTITATAREISASNLSRRLNLRGRAEFAELGDTLDGLFARLQASFESQRHFVANASHELRTPLAAQRTLLQVTLADPDASAASLRTACADVLSLGEQQERLVTALLALATSEGGLAAREPFDLSGLAGAAVSAAAANARGRDLTLTAELRPASGAGDPSLVASLIGNLLDNALRYNQPGGFVRVETGPASGGRTDGGLAESSLAEGGARLRVTNSGPVIAAEQVSGLFRPFARAGADRAGHPEGSGLGLAIVDAIVTAHDGSLSATARPEGGLDIEVRFPPLGPG